MRHIKLFESFLNEEIVKEKFEITATKGMSHDEATKAIDDHYHDNLTYRGNEFFDKIYMKILYEFAEDELNIGEYIKGDEGEDGEIRGQESYLGYIPELDIFVQGWDMFETDSGVNVVFIKLDDKLNPSDAYEELPKPFMNSSEMMYGKNGSLGALHKQIPSIIDIRLD